MMKSSSLEQGGVWFLMYPNVGVLLTPGIKRCAGNALSNLFSKVFSTPVESLRRREAMVQNPSSTGT